MRRIDNKKLILIALSMTLNFLGLTVYFLLDQDVCIVNNIRSCVSMPLPRIQQVCVNEIIRNYGPDFLWSVAFTIAIQVILSLRKEKIHMLLLCCVLGVLYEIMQLLHLVNGTADIIDVIVYFLGSTFGVFIVLGGKVYEEG